MRCEQWQDEFSHVLNNHSEDVQALILDGSVEICPLCNGLSAYAWQDANGYDQFEDGIVPGGFKPATDSIAHIGSASCFEFECGHCGAHVSPVDSPINSPCYTHSED